MFPTRTPEQLAADADAIHVAVCQAPVERRWTIVAEACAGDPALRAAVEMRLIGAQTTSDAVDQGAVEKRSADDGEFRTGALVAGRYRMQQRVGEGGLGVVYLAQQEAPVRRKVAIKVLHAGLESRTAVGRFEAEIGALSRMNHPHVAAIYDAGRTPGGRMYVVMEFIDGEPIDMFCFNHQLSTAETLSLFVKVCRAVQHAHQRGVIHRDLKPLNVLVQLEDEPSPRVIDFGIARSVLGDASLGPRLTLSGVHIGTPEYMSPEQAGLVDAEPDTSSDVYSLGVMLYELLSGRLPVDFEGRREPIYWRKVLADATIVPPSVAARRADAHAHLAARVPRDLDAITMTAMAREPDARYASAAEMASDIERFLDGRPVLARRPGLGYVLTRAVFRRPAVAVGLLVAVVLAVAGLWIAASVNARIDKEHRHSEGELIAAKAERVIAEKAAEGVARTSARSSLVAAVTALQLFDIPAALANLGDMPVSYRGWGEHFLRGQATRWEGRYPIGAGRSAALAIPVEGDLIFIGGEDGVLRAFSTKSLTIVWELSLGSLALQDLAVSSNGRLVAASDRITRVVMVDTAGRLVLWSRAAKARLAPNAFEVKNSRNDVVLVTMAPTKPVSGERAPWRPVLLDAISGAEKDVWDVGVPAGGLAHYCSDGAEERVIVALGGGSTAFSRRGERVWAARGVIESTPGRGCGLGIFVDSVNEGHRDKRSLIDGAFVADMVPSPAGSASAVVGPNGMVAAQEGTAGIGLGDDGSGVPTTRVAAGRTAIRALAFEADGKFLWSADEGGILTRWRSDLSPNPTIVDAGFSNNLAGAVAADGNLQVTTGWGLVRATDGLGQRQRWARWLGRQYITTVSISPAGDRVVVGD